ncbi:MAG TPA: AI-2E family transporter [Bacillota bacterium]
MTDRRRIWRLLGWGAAALALLGVAFALRQVLTPFLLALALAYVLEPPVRALHRRGLGRVWAILVVYALLGLLVGAAIVFLVPQFLRELGYLADQVPQYSARLAGLARSWQQRYASIPLPETVRSAVDDGIRGLEQRTLAAISGIVEALLGVAAASWSLILVPFLAFYMLKDTEQFRRTLLAWLPIEARPHWLRLVHDCDRVLSGFVRGQVIIAVVIGAAVALVAAVLGLPFALLLGILAALGEFVPYFGPILGTLPALVFAVNQSTQTLLQLVMALIIIHQLEQALLYPLILGDGVGLHPLLVIFALLVGGHFFGLAGLIVAVPLAGLLRSFWLFVIGGPAGA